jgi:hypothetical protein
VSPVDSQTSYVTHFLGASTYYRYDKRMYINPVEREPNDPRQGLNQSKVVLHKSACGMSMAMEDAKSRLINTLINNQSTH